MLLRSMRKYGLTAEFTKDTKDFGYFKAPNSRDLVSFVVNICLSIWLRCSRARCFVVKFGSFVVPTPMR